MLVPAHGDVLRGKEACRQALEDHFLPQGRRSGNREGPDIKLSPYAEGIIPLKNYVREPDGGTHIHRNPHAMRALIWPVSRISPPLVAKRKLTLPVCAHRPQFKIKMPPAYTRMPKQDPRKRPTKDDIIE